MSVFSSKDDLKIIINGTNISKKPCHIWTEILDRKDNFFIVRYKLYDKCSNFEISGHYKNIGLGKILHTNVLPDDCMCPTSDLNNFIESWRCGPTPNLVKKQLKEFEKINWDEKRQDVSKICLLRFTKTVPFQIVLKHNVLLSTGNKCIQ